MDDRVVVTGMGTINPLGLCVEESWKNAAAGVSGVGPITRFDASDLLVQIACEVKNFAPEQYMPAKEARRRDLFQQFASAAAVEALHQAGIQPNEPDSQRIGVIVSSAIGGINSILENHSTLLEEGPRRVSPFAIPMFMSNGAAGWIGIDQGIHGPSFSIASACASGSDAIGLAFTLIKTGMIDAAVAGASESPLSRLGVSSFDRVGAMVRRTAEQGGAGIPQPFDKNREGLVMGEGAGVLILERESRARQRGAEILAEIAGYGASADAYHVTAPDEAGSGGAAAIRSALASAKIEPHQVGYINAHGTATPLNDLSETRAIKSALGEAAAQIPVSSTKSMTGHMMGATGAVEAIFCVQAIREGLLPPNINYVTPDPECDLNIIANQAMRRPIEVAISNSFGFGGHNSVLVIRKYVSQQ